jgi:hypothetical protein
MSGCFMWDEVKETRTWSTDNDMALQHHRSNQQNVVDANDDAGTTC